MRVASTALPGTWSLSLIHILALVFARSGLAVREGLALSNGVGVIDSDYRGEICVGLVNLSDKPYTVQNLSLIHI